MDLEKLRRRLPPAVASQWETLQAEFLRTEPAGSDFLTWLRKRHLVDEALLRKGTDQLELSQWPIPDALSDPLLPKELLNAGKEQSRYEALGEVGIGSVGQIALMKDRNLKRKVAVKHIRPELAQHPQVLSRFLTEAQITAQLDHPGIVPVYGLEVESDGNLAYAMKLIQGKTLKDLIREARLIQAKPDKPVPSSEGKSEEYSLSKRLEHFLKVCDALDYAHSRGVIHRDLKPANIMIGPFNEVYVMDWGIARRIQDPDEDLDSELAEKIAPDQGEPLMERTQMGEVLGTPRYMSPQQAAGRSRELDGRSDQFSLGLILYELVCLKPAFEAKSAIELLQKVLKAQLEPLPSKRIPAELRAIIAKATKLNPSERYPSVRELAEDLRRYLRGEAVLARPDSALQKLLRWMGYHRQATLGLGLGLFVLCLLGLSLSIFIQQQTLLKIQAREQKITPLLNQVARFSQDLRRSMLEKEALLEGLSAPALAALNEGYAGSSLEISQLVWQKELKSGFKPDLNKNLPDFKAPVYLGNPKQFSKDLPLLTPLHPIYRQTLLESANYGQPFPSPSLAESLLRKQETPLVRTGLVLAKGLSVVYPGQMLNETDWRSSDWYLKSLKSPQIQWTKLKGEPLFRLSLRLQTFAKVLGLAFVDLQEQDLQRRLKLPADMPALKGLYLLGPEGQEWLRSPEAPPLGADFKPQAMDLQTPGFRENEAQLYAWQPLQQGWALLAHVDLNTLLQSSD